MKYIAMATEGIVTVIVMAQTASPKKLNAAGSCVQWKRLWMKAVHRPQTIPPKMLMR